MKINFTLRYKSSGVVSVLRTRFQPRCERQGMRRWYEFSDPSFEMKTLGELRALWNKIPDHQARSVIAEAHQFFDFNLCMIINRLESWSHPPEERESWFRPSSLALSARAGAVSGAVVSGVSIIECAMRAHAENREIKKVLKKPANYRTLGMLITNWENNHKLKPEIENHLEGLKRVHSHRNGIHLYARFNREWDVILEEEMRLLNDIENLFAFFQELDPH